MTASEILNELEAMGSAQTRKIYKRHGVAGDQYGVSYANLKKLKKKIKVNHEAALVLWASGIHDARVLATMIADPAQADEAILDSWAEDLNNYVLGDGLSAYVGKTGYARKKMEAWIEDDDEWKGQVGWQLLAGIANKDTAMSDADFEPYLATIASDIHERKNRVRYAMNTALIAIGSRNDRLAQQAIAVANTIGTVDVDHGQTSCKTPDAASYIEKTRAYRKEKGK